MTTHQVRICHLTTVHDWNDTRIFVKMSQSASADGCYVDLVAPVSSASPVVNSGNIVVHRLIKYKSRFLRATLGTIRAIREVIQIRAAVYHVHDPELLPAVLTLRLLHRRVVFDFHEEFAAQILSKSYLRGWQRSIASKLARFWEFLLCCSASQIVVATPRIRRSLPIRRLKTAIVCNYPSLDEFVTPTPTPFHHRSRVAYYVGGITEIRGCFEIKEAARILKSSHSGITIRMGGRFDNANLEDTLRDDARRSGICYLGIRSREEVIVDLGDARVGIVVLRAVPNHTYSLPTKMFEYMAAGLAVVASNFPLWQRIIRDARCGLTVDPSDPRAIAHAIRELVDNPSRAQRMGERGRRAIEKEYQWDNEWRRLKTIYASNIA